MTNKKTYEFSPNSFHNRRLMTPQNYFAYISDCAISGGLLTVAEAEVFSKNFKTLGYAPDRAVQLIDNLIKLRLRESRHKKKYEKTNKKVNKDDSFINEILKANEQKKQP